MCSLITVTTTARLKLWKAATGHVNSNSQTLCRSWSRVLSAHFSQAGLQFCSQEVQTWPIWPRVTFPVMLTSMIPNPAPNANFGNKSFGTSVTSWPMNVLMSSTSVAMFSRFWLVKRSRRSKKAHCTVNRLIKHFAVGLLKHLELQLFYRVR